MTHLVSNVSGLQRCVDCHGHDATQNADDWYNKHLQDTSYYSRQKWIPSWTEQRKVHYTKRNPLPKAVFKSETTPQSCMFLSLFLTLRSFDTVEWLTAHVLCSAILCSAPAGSLHSSLMRLWMSDCARFTQHVSIHYIQCTYSYSANWTQQGWCHPKLLPSQHMFYAQYTYWLLGDVVKMPCESAAFLAHIL